MHVCTEGGEGTAMAPFFTQSLSVLKAAGLSFVSVSMALQDPHNPGKETGPFVSQVNEEPL